MTQTKAQVQEELDLLKDEVEGIYERAAIVMDKLNEADEASLGPQGMVTLNAQKKILDDIFDGM